MNSERLIDWFQANNGTFDSSALTFTIIDGFGRSAIALRDLSEGHTLFTLPRDLTLSTRTSKLPNLVGQMEWKKRGLHSGWVGLILSMMWEEAQGSASRWRTYLESLPTSFDTPMFWSPDDLEELKGTAVVEKLGRDQAEADYREKVLPMLQARPDLFEPEELDSHYSLKNYHVMGSRILSRSFQVERWHVNDVESEFDVVSKSPGRTGSADPAMDVDEEHDTINSEGDLMEPGEAIQDDEDSDDDEEDPSDVAMVPMADMLNARYESENAKLFYEEDFLRMTVTKPISAGDQIWNTYGDLPNSELLRRYGHVDMISLPDGDLGNPADIVEVRADIVVEILRRRRENEQLGSITERVDWWLELGGEDVFVVESNGKTPSEMIAFTRLLLISDSDWEKLKLKTRLPKPKTDMDVLSLAVDVFQTRLSDYSTTVEEDKAILSSTTEDGKLSINRRHAVSVRLGEKRVLHKALQDLREKIASSSFSTTKVPKVKVQNKKRKLDEPADRKEGGVKKPVRR
ncbi:SET domain-containing protein [Artomyces pyxidatus]|uniref:SET domain-containing protein n=1 Tax=Artomyces pyxidatus TaxID=48021 RepID=A0ACB8TBT3_9AGAM|nr:SET domain-containing protein [Artomyces pyxidatus]